MSPCLVMTPVAMLFSIMFYQQITILALHFLFVHSYNTCCQLCSSRATFYTVCYLFFLLCTLPTSILVVLHLYIMADIIHSLYTLRIKHIDKVLFIVSVFVKWSLSGCYTLFYFIFVFFCLMLSPVLRKCTPGSLPALHLLFLWCFFGDTSCWYKRQCVLIIVRWGSNINVMVYI